MKLKSNHSFSLIELMVVVTLLTIACMIALPSFSFLDRLILEHELGHIFVVFTSLQQKALATNEVQKLTFIPATNMYRYLSITDTWCDHYLDKKVCFGIFPHVKGPPSSPKQPLKSCITFSNNTVIFSPDGNITPGAVYITTKQHTTLVALTCPISQVSCIRKYRYQHKKWYHIKL